MSLHDHSSIRTTIEMPDFDFSQRQFPNRLSHLLLSATKCSNLKSATMAAARPATAEQLLKPGNACCSQRVATLLGSWAPSRAQAFRQRHCGGTSELLRGALLSGPVLRLLPPQRISSRCMVLCVTRESPLCKQQGDGLECSFFITW